MLLDGPSLHLFRNDPFPQRQRLSVRYTPYDWRDTHPIPSQRSVPVNRSVESPRHLAGEYVPLTCRRPSTGGDCPPKEQGLVVATRKRRVQKDTPERREREESLSPYN